MAVETFFFLEINTFKATHSAKFYVQERFSFSEGTGFLEISNRFAIAGHQISRRRPQNFTLRAAGRRPLLLIIAPKIIRTA